jgi:hypothetical protein
MKYYYLLLSLIFSTSLYAVDTTITSNNAAEKIKEELVSLFQSNDRTKSTQLIEKIFSPKILKNKVDAFVDEFQDFEVEKVNFPSEDSKTTLLIKHKLINQLFVFSFMLTQSSPYQIENLKMNPSKFTKENMPIPKLNDEQI